MAHDIRITEIRNNPPGPDGPPRLNQEYVIIENADRMQDSSRNALLKLLEEPPANAYLFLLTTRRSLIIPTIRSRLRAFPFPQRPPAVEREVLKVIFHEDSKEYRSLRDFFLAWKNISHSELERQARAFFDSLLSSHGTRATRSSESSGVGLPEELIELIRGKTAADTLTGFLEELLFLMRSGLRQGCRDGDEIPLDTLERWSELVHGSTTSLNSLKLNPQLVLEDLYFRMREAL